LTHVHSLGRIARWETEPSRALQFNPNELNQELDILFGKAALDRIQNVDALLMALAVNRVSLDHVQHASQHF